MHCVFIDFIGGNVIYDYIRSSNTTRAATTCNGKSAILIGLHLSVASGITHGSVSSNEETYCLRAKNTDDAPFGIELTESVASITPSARRDN